MPPNLPKDILKLAAELIKHQAKKQLGDGFIDVLSSRLVDYAGDNALEKVNALLESGKNAENLLAAFQDADKEFGTGDDTLRQMIVSKPLSQLESLEKLAKVLPKTLDDDGFLEVIRHQFETDWPKHSAEVHARAAHTYRLCLERSLAVRCGQILPSIFTKIERIEETVQQIHSHQFDLQQQFQRLERFSSSQSENLLQQLSGVSGLIKFQKFELSPPDNPPLHPITFLRREGLIQELQRNLNGATCLCLVDGSGKGKTQLAVSLYDLYKEHKKYWMSFRGKPELQERHLYTQIIRWLFQLTGESSYWQQYVLGDITFSEISSLLGKALENKGLLVIDDLPNPVEATGLFEDLEILVKNFSDFDSKIIMTSQWRLPPFLESHFPSLISTHSCPYFSSDEILSLLRTIQIPPAFQNENIAALVNATTKGHPILVVATLSWLEKRKGDSKIETFDDLISGESVKDTLEYSRKILIRTLDEEPKKLLYRLSLVGEKLDKDLVFEIANVFPAISNPSDQFDKLIGPWVDRLDRKRFDVSPLLLRVGENNISLETQEKIHNLCVDKYLQTHKINISDLHTILMHLWQAHNYVKFANILLLALMAVKTYEQAKYISWACSLILGVPWPDELDTHWQIMIRSAQVRVSALANENYKRINDDLNLLLSDANIERDSLALLFAYMATGVFAENLSLDISIPRSFAALRLINSSPSLKNGFPNEAFVQMPDVIWAYANRIKERHHIKLFLDELNGLDKNIREMFYDAPFAVEISSHIIDQIWFSEGGKSQEKQDWADVVSFLDQLAAMQCVQESECLKVSIVRSKAVVYADYLKQSDQAIEILSNLLSSNNSDISFLVSYSMGCFAFDAGKVADAINFLTAAENKDGDGFSYYRFDATKRLAIAFGKRNEWNIAKNYCIKAICDLKARYKDEGLSSLELCELLGELACIYWESNLPTKACAALYGCVKNLVKNESNEDERFKEAFNKTGHALGWFLSMAAFGIPPPKTANGEEYAPVQPGLFGIRRTQLGKFVSPMGFSLSHLFIQLSLFASATGLLRTSKSTYELSLEYSKLENRSDIHSQTVYAELATLETIYGNPHKALQYGIHARNFFLATSWLGENPKHSDYLASLSETFRSAKFTKNDYRKSEERLLYTIFAPLFVKLIGSNLSITDILEELERWKIEVLTLKSELYLVDEWIKLLQYFQDMILFWKGDSDIDEKFMFFDHSTSFEIFRMLLKSDRPHVSINDAYQMQVSVAISLLRYSQYAKYMYSGVGRFVHRYWLRVAQTQRFALRHPSLFLDGLLAISPNEGADTLYEVLASAGQAVGIYLSDNAKAQMESVKKTARPWLQI